MLLLTLKIIEKTLIPATKSQWEPCLGIGTVAALVYVISF